MKIAASMTTSITMPRNSRPVIARASDLELFPVRELAPEADLVAALERLRDPLDHEESRRERDRGAEGPHDRAPHALLRALGGNIRVPRVVDADPHQGDHRGEEEDEVRGEVDHPFFSLREP